MSRIYDAIIIGLGGMGSAAAYHLARSGQRVLGLEQFTPAHDQGSSHGQSRIIRQAYFEDPAYVPLLLRAYELWEDLQRTTGDDTLLRLTGALMLGRPETDAVAGALRSAQTWNLPHELLTAADIRRRHPAFAVTDDEVALYEAKGGILAPERCIDAHLRLAERQGAELHFQEAVTTWEARPGGEGVAVSTARGRYEAGRLVLAAGAWSGPLLERSGLRLPLTVERQVMHWFKPKFNPGWFAPELMPVFVWERPGFHYYGFPALDADGCKMGIHHGGEATTAATLRRTVDEADTDRMREGVRQLFPALAETPRRSVVCMYTNTPDLNFVVDQHPEFPQVAVAAGFSGHGFKFCSVVGEALAEMAQQGETRLPIAHLRMGRFTGAK